MQLTLTDKLVNREAIIGVVGLGYVGLPLAAGFARLGFTTIGVDIDANRIEMLARGECYLEDIDAAEIAALTQSKRFRPADDFSLLAAADAIMICVPTPITANKSPDLSYVLRAAESLVGVLRHGQLVVLQSTTHPGTTEDDVLPVLERSGLRAGIDFHLAFCPERINPGDREFTVVNTPKVVGGVTPECTRLASALMSSFGAGVHQVSSPRVAEMAKLLENIFRSVNISLVNEMAMLSERMRIDFWEVIGAASTKPFGFMPFYPGPGVGGHCIPVDPFYLSAKAREYDFAARFVELAAEINQTMPYHAVEKTAQALASQGKVIDGSNILVLGVAFKRDVDDARNSAAERIIELLLNAGANVTYSDPHIPSFRVGGNAIRRERSDLYSVDLTDQLLAGSDCALIVAGHSAVDYGRVLDRCVLVVDTVNALGSAGSTDRRVFSIGRPSPA